MCFDARTVQLKTQNMRFTAAFLMPEPAASSGRSGFLCSGVQPGHFSPLLRPVEARMLCALAFSEAMV